MIESTLGVVVFPNDVSLCMSLGGPQHPHGFTLSVHNITGSRHFRVPAFRSQRLVIASLKKKEGDPLGILGVPGS